MHPKKKKKKKMMMMTGHLYQLMLIEVEKIVVQFVQTKRAVSVDNGRVKHWKCCQRLLEIVMNCYELVY